MQAERKSSGFVLEGQDVDHRTIAKPGTVKIKYVDTHLQIEVEGFEFNDRPTCRMAAVKAMIWARRVLDAKIQAEMLAPGASGASVN